MGRLVNVWKYARPEFERRFLLSRIPVGPVEQRRRIVDRYFAGTQLRLRMVTTGEYREYKLTQKVPDPADGTRGRITTMYLTPAAFTLLEGLPGAELCKSRLSIPPFGVDVFEGALAGLVIAECEASTGEDLAAYAPPSDALAEVTDDERFAGGRLATTRAEELRELLAPFSI